MEENCERKRIRKEIVKRNFRVEDGNNEELITRLIQDINR